MIPSNEKNSCSSNGSGGDQLRSLKSGYVCKSEQLPAANLNFSKNSCLTNIFQNNRTAAAAAVAAAVTGAAAVSSNLQQQPGLLGRHPGSAAVAALQ